MNNKIIYVSLIVFMSFLLVGCTSNKADNYKETRDDYSLFDMYDLYTLQSKSKYKESDCVSCFDNAMITNAFCRNEENLIIDGESATLSDALNNKLLSIDQVECLINHNVVKHYRFPYIIYKIGEIIFKIIKGL